MLRLLGEDAGKTDVKQLCIKGLAKACVNEPVISNGINQKRRTTDPVLNVQKQLLATLKNLTREPRNCATECLHAKMQLRNCLRILSCLDEANDTPDVLQQAQ